MRNSLLPLTVITLLVSPLKAVPLTLSCPHQNITFQIEVAHTPKERKKGLMFRKILPQDTGMLFSYEKPTPVAMWMKNTYVPLDIIFVDAKGAILALYESTTPHSLTPIGPVEGTVHALEVGGGTIQAHKITPECVLRLEK